MFKVLISWIIIYFKVILASKKWVDPHDMNIEVNPTQKNSAGYGSNDCDKFYKEKNYLYLRRVIGLIAKNVELDMESNIYKGQMDIKLNMEEYAFLKQFISSNDMDAKSLRQLNTILDNALQKGTLKEDVLKAGRYIYLTFFTQHTYLFLSLVFLLFVVWKMNPPKYTIKFFIKSITFLVCLSDFFLKYLALTKEVEIEKYLELKKKQCDTSTLKWIDWLFEKLTGSCQEIETNFLVSQRVAIYIITVFRVLSDQFRKIVLISKYVGGEFDKFTILLTEDVSKHMKTNLIALVLILVVLVILMMACRKFEISPRFSIRNILQLEFVPLGRNMPNLRESVMQ